MPLPFSAPDRTCSASTMHARRTTAGDRDSSSSSPRTTSNAQSVRSSEGLPDEFRGWPTRFGWDDVPVSHHVQVLTLREWLVGRLGFDPRDGVRLRDWLATPQQILLETTSGAVYRDESGELEQVRNALAWYPDDVWLWLLACQWRRIDQEEPFVGRAAEVGDELGSRVLAARIARDLVRLCFLLERRYAPYSKWLGSSFRELPGSAAIGDALLEALAATEHGTREDALVRAAQGVAALHNASWCDGPGRRRRRVLPLSTVPRARLEPFRRRVPRARLRPAAARSSARRSDRPARGLDGPPERPGRVPVGSGAVRRLARRRRRRSVARARRRSAASQRRRSRCARPARARAALRLRTPRRGGLPPRTTAA